MIARGGIGGICSRMTLAEALFRNDAASDAVSDVCRRFRVRQLDIFGSAATGNSFDPARSDLDFLVTFEPLTPVDYADAFFGLREALEALSGRPIDLVTEAALENPHLRRRVESQRRTLFRAP
jgi:predicted nucleotidyltransferase